MEIFKFRELKNCNNEKELESIGFDSSYRLRATEKMDNRLIKIYSLTPAQANILKQTALSIGADCMTHREVITGKEELSNVIITCSTSELKKISNKLKRQPFKLKNLGEELIKYTENKKNNTATKLVGILNITPDSFSDGGMYDEPQNAIKQLLQLIDDGADIIDIGAESTKPFSKEVPANVQIERLLPVLDFINKEQITTPISIDTRSAEVAQVALSRGCSIINDVSGLTHDSQMAEIIAKYDATVIIQHTNTTPDTMQINPTYSDLMEEIYLYLEDKIRFAKTKGINSIIIDPGIGFGKTKEHNLTIIDRFEELNTLGYPIMLGTSRKSFLGIPTDDNNLKDTMTLAINSRLIEKGIDYLRIHNVKLHKTFLNNI